MEKSGWVCRRRRLKGVFVRQLCIQQANAIALDRREKWDQPEIWVLAKLRFLGELNCEEFKLGAQLNTISCVNRHQLDRQGLR